PAASVRYGGITTPTACASRASAGGSGPRTAASPPVLANGVISEPTIRMRMTQITLPLVRRRPTGRDVDAEGDSPGNGRYECLLRLGWCRPGGQRRGRLEGATEQVLGLGRQPVQ